MKTLEKILQRKQESVFDDWNEKNGLWDKIYETHADTNCALACNSDLLNEKEYIAHVKENKEELIEEMLEIINNNAEFKEFLFNKFLETI